MAKRNYQNNYPSVTQVLGILRKIGLEMWFKFNTAQFCNETSKKGREVGTEIHQAIEDYINGKDVKLETQYATEVSNALKGFMKFKKEHPEFELELTETELTSEKYKYNGTMDCRGTKKLEKPKRVMFDWKTGNCKEKTEPPIYDEHRYQASAYFKVYNELNEEQLEEAYILVLAKDKVAYYLERLSANLLEEMFEQVFLPALKICNYQRGG